MRHFMGIAHVEMGSRHLRRLFQRIFPKRKVVFPCRIALERQERKYEHEPAPDRHGIPAQRGTLQKKSQSEAESRGKRNQHIEGHDKDGEQRQ